MLLEVGCGEEKIGDIGVDIRPTPAVDVLADCYNLPFRDEAFDQTMSITLLEHTLNPFNALKEQVRVLKKGGKITCETDCARYWRYHVKLQDHVHHFATSPNAYNPSDTHYCIFYPENVEKMFALLKLNRIQWWYVNNKLKLNRLIRLIPYFRQNTYGRFRIIGWK